MGNIHSGETTTLTIRIPVEMKEQLSALGKSSRRSNSFLAAEAVADYIAREKQIIAMIQEGLDDVGAGRVVPHEQVMREVRDIIKNARLKKKNK